MTRATQAESLLTFDEVAERCGVHKGTIRRAIAAGELVAVNAPGTRGARGRRVTASSLKAYLERQARGGKK